MRVDNYYVNEYKRVIDNVKVTEDVLTKVAVDVEERANNLTAGNSKKIVAFSAIAVTVGVAACVVLRKGKFKS